MAINWDEDRITDIESGLSIAGRMWDAQCFSVATKKREAEILTELRAAQETLEDLISDFGQGV